MSAFEVSDDHIDAMLTAGIELARGAYSYGPLRWMTSAEIPADAYQEGEPWGPAAVAWQRENRRELTRETADAVGAMLRAENRRSVDYRYAESELEPIYTFHALRWGNVDHVRRLVIVLKAIDCYEYQACEHPEWAVSEAHAFCAALRQLCIARLPGMTDAPGWEIHDRNVFATVERQHA